MSLWTCKNLNIFAHLVPCDYWSENVGIVQVYRDIIMPPYRMIGGILFLSCLFACLFVCLAVCLSVVNFNIRYNF